MFAFCVSTAIAYTDRTSKVLCRKRFALFVMEDLFQRKNFYS